MLVFIYWKITLHVSGVFRTCIVLRLVGSYIYRVRMHGTMNIKKPVEEFAVLTLLDSEDDGSRVRRKVVNCLPIDTKQNSRDFCLPHIIDFKYVI